jgi:uncharacterized phage protein gp47/JayE
MSTTPTITQLTPTGLVVSLLDDRIAQLTTALQGIFGEDINVDANSFDGQTIGIMSESINNLDQLAEALYQAFNPNTATGAALSLLVQLNGITRNLGSYSVVDLVCTGSVSADVPAGSLISSADGTTQWETSTDAVIDSTGSTTVSAQCTEIGAIAGLANTLTTISSPTYGWLTVSNTEDAVVGSNQETDSDLRARRNDSVGESAQGIIEAIQAAVSNVTGVTQAQVYENPTDSAAVSTDNPYGLAPHSINAVVLGGANSDIAEAIWLKRSGGLVMLGATQVPITDSFGNMHNMYFDRPTAVPIYIVLNVHVSSKYPSNGDALITAAILTWALSNQLIGINVVQSELYTPINTVAGVSVRSLYIGTAPSPSSSSDITIPYKDIAQFSSINITINHV